MLDFAGARLADFDGWTEWSSRTAGRGELSDDIEAGHGNGGKSFMVWGATDFAFLESCFEGKRTRMGFTNDRPAVRYKPGPALENGIKQEDVDEPAPETRLANFLVIRVSPPVIFRQGLGRSSKSVSPLLRSSPRRCH